LFLIDETLTPPAPQPESEPAPYGPIISSNELGEPEPKDPNLYLLADPRFLFLDPFGRPACFRLRPLLDRLECLDRLDRLECLDRLDLFLEPFGLPACFRLRPLLDRLDLFLYELGIIL